MSSKRKVDLEKRSARMLIRDPGPVAEAQVRAMLTDAGCTLNLVRIHRQGNRIMDRAARLATAHKARRAARSERASRRMAEEARKQERTRAARLVGEAVR